MYAIFLESAAITDIPVFVINPVRKLNPIVAGPASFLGWIVLLAVLFRVLLRAEVTREWLIAGAAVGVGVIFLILMLHEAADALGSPGEKRKQPAASRPREGRAQFGFATDSFGTDRIDWAFADEHRAALGLRGRNGGANRFR